MLVVKITYGYVEQKYDTVTKKFVSQSFTAGDEVDWQNMIGDKVDIPDGEPYLPFFMVQPND